MEVRWFGRGTVAPEMRVWFQAGKRRPEEEGSRVDYYLRSPDTDSLGIKVREGKVEVKQLQRQHGVVGFHNRVMGVMQHWRKWSFPLAQPGILAEALSPASAWTAVQKERELLKYQVTDIGAVVAIPSDQYPARGSYVELAQVAAAADVWWSLALEAFGDESQLAESLLLVAQHVFTAGDTPSLEAQDSYSYPTWLQQYSKRRP
jgi:hypothetical protein